MNVKKLLCLLLALAVLATCAAGCRDKKENAEVAEQGSEQTEELEGTKEEEPVVEPVKPLEDGGEYSVEISEEDLDELEEGDEIVVDGD